MHSLECAEKHGRTAIITAPAFVIRIFIMSLTGPSRDLETKMLGRVGSHTLAEVASR